MITVSSHNNSVCHIRCYDLLYQAIIIQFVKMLWFTVSSHTNPVCHVRCYDNCIKP